MDNKRLDQMKYAEFAEAFSVGEPRVSTNRFYAAPNETKCADVVKEIRKDLPQDAVLHYVGVSSSGDRNLDYIASLGAERGFLFDFAAKPRHYLGLRLCLLQDGKIGTEHFMDMLGLKDDEREELRASQSIDETIRLMKRMDIDKKLLASRLAGQGANFMRRLGYTTKGDEDPMLLQERGDVFYNPEFRREAAIDIARYMERIFSGGRDEFMCSWFFGPNFAKLQKMARGNHIRGFNADLFNGFVDQAEILIDEYQMKNLVLYISNIPEILDTRYHEEFGGDRQKVVDALSRDLDSVFEPLAKKVDRLWVVDSMAEKNRVLYHKKP
jgi:hypothetical protein